MCQINKALFFHTTKINNVEGSLQMHKLNCTKLCQVAQMLRLRAVFDVCSHLQLSFLLSSVDPHSNRYSTLLSHSNYHKRLSEYGGPSFLQYYIVVRRSLKKSSNFIYFFFKHIKRENWDVFQF